MARVLFVCVENANRSQMAEGLAVMRGAGVLEPMSAGSRPTGAVNPRAVAFMSELGYDLSTHSSKSLSEVGAGPWDYLITMGCGDACPQLMARHREDWGLLDPAELSDEGFRAVRDEIGRRIDDLVERVREGSFEANRPETQHAQRRRDPASRSQGS